MTSYSVRNRWGAAVSLHQANGRNAVLWIVGICAAIFLVHLGITVTAGEIENPGAILGFLVVFLAIGMVLAITQMLPFALSLGLTRRTFYLVSAALYVVAALVLTLAMAAFAGVEALTGGWGVGLALFGGWQGLPMSVLAVWVSSFSVLTVGIFTGALAGAIYARWRTTGMWAAMVVLILLGGIIAMLFTWQSGARALGQAYDALGLEAVMIGGSLLVAGLTGVGAHLVIRRTPF